MKAETRESITGWWERLQKNSGGRAKLKRCQSPEEAALLSETFTLSAMLPWLSLEAVATIAGVAAHIKKPDNEKVDKQSRKFGESLATPKEKSGRVPLSETRFRQLITARDWNEVYRSLRRAVTILDGRVDLISFAETVILWNDEFEGRYKKPGTGLKFELSKDYYTKVMKTKK